MQLRKIIALLVLAMCLTMAMPVLAADGTPITNTEQPNKSAHAQQLMNRLKEIRDMDKSHLTASEKKELRKEVRAIKKDNKKGVYLSVGAIIIILLLLILLL